MARFIERYWGVDPLQMVSLEKDLADYQKAPLGVGIPAITATPNFLPTASYGKREIDGWRVFVNPSLEDQPGLGATTLKLLSYKLHMIDHFIGEQGRKQLHEV